MVECGCSIRVRPEKKGVIVLNSREMVIAFFRDRIPDEVYLYDLVRNRKVIEIHTGEQLTYENENEVIPRAIKNPWI